jgi:hypothetical protein
VPSEVKIGVVGQIDWSGFGARCGQLKQNRIFITQRVGCVDQETPRVSLLAIFAQIRESHLCADDASLPDSLNKI